jgi:hypothetical protein
MTFFERLENATRLWTFVNPNIPVPPDGTLTRWLVSYTDEEFEQSVLSIPGRTKNWTKKYGCIKPVEVYKYTSAHLYDIRQRTVRHIGESRITVPASVTQDSESTVNEQ